MLHVTHLNWGDQIAHETSTFLRTISADTLVKKWNSQSRSDVLNWIFQLTSTRHATVKILEVKFFPSFFEFFIDLGWVCHASARPICECRFNAHKRKRHGWLCFISSKRSKFLLLNTRRFFNGGWAVRDGNRYLIDIAAIKDGDAQLTSVHGQGP